jgi:1-acyl-sn-glycerol-3-phosphate acyltransferase
MTAPPTHQPRFPSHLLTLTERVTLKVMEAINRPGWIQRVMVLYGRHLCQRLVKAIYYRRLRVEGIELLRDVPPSAPLLVISNHRTFFDQFVIATALREETHHRLGVPCVFPVRAPFFYSNPIGALMCLMASGGCMYPPVFRDQRKGELNAAGVEVMRWLLTQPRVALGIHPEGRRSKNPDPFTLDDPKRGVGVLIEGAGPELMVLPVFVEGLSNGFGGELLRAFQGRRARPIHITWGAPFRAADLTGTPEELAAQAHAHIQRLAEAARAVRGAPLAPPAPLAH